MKNLIILIVIVLYLLTITPAKAMENEFSASSRLQIQNNLVTDNRPAKLKAYLISKNSPLADYVSDFVLYADTYNLDWKLAVAISGIESNFGQAYIKESNNPFGLGGGNIYFKDMKEAIAYLNKLIATDPFYQKFQVNRDIANLAIIYCESYSKWIAWVSNFMLEIDNYSEKSSQTPLKITL